jgi:hypothetical protein
VTITVEHPTVSKLPPIVLTRPDAESWMAHLDLLMSSREDAYEDMRRSIPGLAWSAAERVDLTSRQQAATARFDELNRLVRDYRSA